MTKIRQELKNLIAPFVTAQWRANLYTGVALALMLVYLIQGNHRFFVEQLAPSCCPNLLPLQLEWWGTLYQFAAAFVLFFLIPMVLLKTLGGEKLKDLGLGMGDVKFGFWVVVVGLLLIALPGGFSAGSMPDFLQEYPLAKLSTESPGRFALYELAYGLLYYVAWEAFFRGFLQLGLSKHIGDVAAILVQTSASTLLHIGKPAGEIWAALLAGFLFGTLILRTRSIWPLVLVHWGLGFFTDFFCAKGMGSL